MKRILALLLCLLLVFQLAACQVQGQPSILQMFSDWLKDGGYQTVTTTGPDGITTTTLTPPGTTRSSSSTRPVTQPTTPSGQPTTVPSVQPTTTPGPGGSSEPGGPGEGTGQPTSTVTVPQVTTDPVVLKLPQSYVLLPAIGASCNLCPTDIPAVAIQWISEDNTVAEVNNGVVTARGMGTVRIIAIYQGQTAYCTVTVQIPTTDPTTGPRTLKLNPSTLSLNVGQFLQYSTATTGNIPVEEISWSSTDPTVASVAAGKVTALKAGSCKINASWNGQKVTVNVVVKDTAPDAVITLTQRYLTMLVGSSTNIYTGNIPAAEVTWVNTDPTVASLSNGLVTALKPGQTIIRAIYKDKSAFCTVTVQQVTTDPTTAPTTVPTTKPTTVPTTTTGSSATHTAVPYTQRYLYSLLTEEEKGWYRKIDTAVNSLQDSVSLNVDLTQNERHTIYFIYMFDNPEHFYLGGRVSYSSGGTLYMSYSDGTTNSYRGGTVSALTSTMRTNIRARKAAFDAEVARIISAIPANLPDVEKELMIYDRLLIDMRYNRDAVTGNLWDGVAEVNWTAYGGIINKTGVCEAYAEAFQTLCYAVGINCTGIVGEANGGGHKWNAVQLEGQWYACDVTFDDPLTTGGVEFRPGVANFHDYFNLTTAQMEADGHTTDGSDRPGPDCTGTKYSYTNYFS